MALTSDAVGLAEGAEYVVTNSTLSCMTYVQSATLVFLILKYYVVYGRCRYLWHCPRVLALITWLILTEQYWARSIVKSHNCRAHTLWCVSKSYSTRRSSPVLSGYGFAIYHVAQDQRWRLTLALFDLMVKVLVLDEFALLSCHLLVQFWSRIFPWLGQYHLPIIMGTRSSTM